ncbi:MAG TPA: UDPGP type 1 family protein [Victivallales bacterium]|nr:UDPGP type 1 family protein [Victivallales bacterium]
MYNELYETLSKHNQEHLLLFWDQLNSAQKDKLADQIRNINWDQLDELIKEYVIKKPETKIPVDLKPADYYPMNPDAEEYKKLYIEAENKGKKLVSESKIAAFTVAGGQGTRLGFDGPKGTYPITPIKGKTLFQYFAETIKRASEKYDAEIPWYIMTSKLNNDETVNFFKANDYFNLSKKNVMFFQQGTMPVIDRNGKVLLDEKDSIALSPDGHGGSLLALKKSGALDDMGKRGIEYISYFQVDNPLVSIINPLFIGLHSFTTSEMSAIMLAKTGPYEKLGNFCAAEGRTVIIEYSDMPDELVEKTDNEGNLCFISGSPAIHIISVDFVDKLTAKLVIDLPWHRADKKVSYIDSSGKHVIPEDVNAVKLESFIFDSLPLASKTMILEAGREDEFAPTKNKKGVDSVDSCREMLVEKDCKRLEKYTAIKLPKNADGNYDIVIELSPLSFIDGEDIKNNENRLNKINFSKNQKVYVE